jgi:ABC-2 type transport system ATP-binding protein
MTTPQNRTVESGGNEPRELAVVLRGVSHFFKSYQVRALTDVTFAVRRGEVFGLLGPKGSGKSTVLGIIAGRWRPTEGSVTVFNRSPRRPSTRSRISYLAEKAGESNSTGWSVFFKQFFRSKQNSSSGSANESLPGTPRRAQLTHVLARNADLLVLDEPFAGLDPAGVREVKELIRALAQRGRTVILSSDSLSDAKDVCDRFGFLFDGKMQAAGTLDQLLAAPDALRFAAPVLPAATADRLLKIVREEIGAPALPVSAPEHSLDAAANTAQKIPQAQPAATATATESILTPLLKAQTSSSPAAASSESRKAAADPVNHQKLAELTRSAADSSSPAKSK